jgi:autotransporter-associated beta strand protein
MGRAIVGAVSLASLVAASVASLVAASVASAQLRAFPEAEGFGAYVTGGRGGAVYRVTNLNDSGAGSFRDAVSQPNRIVVFAVGGYINLLSPLTVKNNITIAGQTAPGEGIATLGQSVSFKGAANTIVRNMRFRAGPTATGDAVWADATSGLIFDHISAQWGMDETLSITDCQNVTIQNSIIAEGLLTHSMGSLIEWNTISMHHNLYISNNSRNPKTKGVNDFVNNVVYNWGTEPYIAGDSAGVSQANVVNNYFIRGPSSGADPDPFSRGNSNYQLYLSGNYYDSNRNGVVDGVLLTPAMIDDPMTYVPTPFAYPSIRTDTALAAYNKVVAKVGASLVRDSIDQRLISDLVNQTGSILTDPATRPPGYGTIAGGAAPLDTDQDGMPDAWETARGLNPNNATDRNNLAPSGYTRVEEYLNDLMTARNAQNVWSSAAGNWSNAANWTGGLPSTDTDAFVRGASPAGNGVVDIASGTASAFRLYIGQNGAPAGERVNVSGTGVLDVPYLITVGYQNAGTLNVSGGTVTAWAIALGNTLNGTFHGNLNFSGGTIRAGRIDLGGTGSFNWSGGTLQALGSQMTITPDFAISGAAGTLDAPTGATITVSGAISGNAGITKTGGGSLTLSNTTSSYTGPTVINGGGTLVVGLLANGGSPSSVGSSSSAASNLVLNGGVTLQFAGNSSSNRGITIDAGGATLRTNTGITFTLSGPMVFSGAGDRTLTIDLAGTSSNISTLSGAIPDPADGKVSLVKNGAARLSLAGSTKTYSGDTSINAGTVLAYATNVLPYGSGKGNVTVASGATLDLRFNTNINGLNGTGSVVNGSGGARTFTLGNGNASGNFSGPITNATSIVKVGTGTQILSGANTYTGTTTISGGILQFGQVGSVGGSGASVTIAAGAVAATGFPIDQSFLARVNTASAGAVALAVDSAGNLDFSSATGANLSAVSLGSVGNTTYTGTITPHGSTYRLGGGTGTLMLPNTNALTGARDVLIVAGGATAPTSSNDYTGITTIAAGGRLIANTFANGGVTCSVGAASNAPGNLVLDGGTLELTAAATSDRGMTVSESGGTIRVGSAGATFNGAIVSSGSGDRSLTFDLLGGTTWQAGAISDPTGAKLSLVKTGAGRLGLTGGTRGYSGDTVVNAGTLMPYATNVLPYGAGKGNLVMQPGTALDVRNNININGLNGSGSISNTVGGARSVTLGNGNADGSFSGSISTAISIIKTGSGTQSLNGANSYTGTTTVNGGTLLVNGSTSASSAVSVNNNATLGGSGTVGGAVTINAGGSLAPGNGAGTVGTLTVGSISLNAAATTRVDLVSAVIHDQLAVVGNASLNGPLNVSLGFTPARSDAFTVLTAATRTGSFNNANTWGLIPAGAGAFVVDYSPTSVVLRDFTRPGDVNLDSSINNQDIATFVALLTGGTPAGATGFAADVNADGFVNNQDIAPFVALLTGGRPLGEFTNDPDFAPLLSLVPEPSLPGLLLVGSLAAGRRRARGRAGSPRP